MRTAQLALTAAEAALAVGVLVTYLVWVTQSLRRSSASLAKVTFGVRAIETQCAPIGSVVTRINSQLEGIARALGGVADLAEQAPGNGHATALQPDPGGF